MSPKAIIDVEIDSEGRFAEFVRLYEKWQGQLSQLGPKWAPSEEAVDHISDSAKETAAALAAQNELLQKQAEARRRAERDEEKAERRTREAEKAATRHAAERARETKRVAENTKAAAANVLKTGVTLAKWAAFGGLFSFGAAALGMFGLGRLAEGVGESRRSAMGLGTTTGAEQAFTLNFGKLVDARANLQKIAEAQNSLSDRWAFAPFGIARPQDKDPAAMAALMAPRAKQLFERGGKTQEFAEAYGLTKFYSMEELRRLANTSMEEVRATAAAYQRDAASGMTDKVAKGEQDLSITLKRAERNIKNAFVTGIAPVIPNLERLANVVTDLITTTLQGDKFAKFIDDAADGAEKFAKYLGSEQFRYDFDRFRDKASEVADNLGLVAKGLINLFRVLHLLPEDPAVVEAGNRKVSAMAGDRNANPASRAQAMRFFMGKGWSREQAAGIVSNLEAESGLNPKAVGDSGKAKGLPQLHPNRQEDFRRWAGFSIDDPRATAEKQMAFVDYELRQGKEQKAGRLLAQKKRADEASDVVTFNYERPANPAQRAVARASVAEAIARGTYDETADFKRAANDTRPKPAPKTPAQEGRAPAMTYPHPNFGSPNSKGTRPAVDISIKNATGGSAVVSANQVR